MPLFEVISGLFHHVSRYNPRYLNTGAASSGNVAINTEADTEQELLQGISPAVLQKHFQKAVNKQIVKRGLADQEEEEQPEASDTEQELLQGVSPAVLQKHYQKAVNKQIIKHGLVNQEEEEQETEDATETQQQQSASRKPVMPQVIPGVDLNDKKQRHIIKKRISHQVQKIIERSGADINNLDMQGLLQQLTAQMGGGQQPQPRPAARPQRRQPEPDVAQLLKQFQPRPQPSPEPQPDLSQQSTGSLLQQLQQLLGQAQTVPPAADEVNQKPSEADNSQPTPRHPYRGNLDTKNQFLSASTGGIDTGVSSNGGKITS